MVRAVAADGSLEQRKTANPVALLVEAVWLSIRAVYRAARRRPLRAPGFVVGVIDESSLRGGVVHTESVALASGVAAKMGELSARVEAGNIP